MSFNQLLFALVSFCLFFPSCAPIQYVELKQSSHSRNFIGSKDLTSHEEGFYGSFPKDRNEYVDKWIRYFSEGSGRKHMSVYLERSSRYIPLMRAIFRKHNLPEDLVYVAMVESGFSSKAVSSKQAVGYWQFISSTGRRYGLKIDSYVDERRDFVLATDAAARYFKDLYSLFDDWRLALASYNAGERRITDAVFNTYNRDFWNLVKKEKIPKETANFVPKILAMKEIATHPWKYNFHDLEYKNSLAYRSVYLDKSFSLNNLSEVLDVPYEQILSLNPKYKKDVVPLYEKDQVEIRIPAQVNAI